MGDYNQLPAFMPIALWGPITVSVCELFHAISHSFYPSICFQEENPPPSFGQLVLWLWVSCLSPFLPTGHLQLPEVTSSWTVNTLGAILDCQIFSWEYILGNFDAGKDWGQEEKRVTEDEMVGWHHRLSGHKFMQTPGDSEGQESLVCCSPWGDKESDTTERLNSNTMQRRRMDFFFFLVQTKLTHSQQIDLFISAYSQLQRWVHVPVCESHHPSSGQSNAWVLGNRNCFKSFLFYIGVSPINNVVIVSGGQQRDSATHIHEPILPQTPLPTRLPHDMEQSSLSFIMGPYWLSILNIAVCTCPSHTH